jgi:hypothetical protein
MVLGTVVETGEAQGSWIESGGGDDTACASRCPRSMLATNSAVEKRDEVESCDHDWCSGPKEDRLPYFVCFQVAHRTEGRSDAR